MTDRSTSVSTVPLEARPFQGERAGVVSRVLANTIDFGVLLAILGGLYIGWAALRLLIRGADFRFPTPEPLLVFLLGSLILGLYFAASWTTAGRTYGDHVLGLRVVNLRGRRMRIGGALLRAAFCVAFPIGLFWAVISRENRSIQDVVLRTSVIYDWEILPARARPDPREEPSSVSP